MFARFLQTARIRRHDEDELGGVKGFCTSIWPNLWTRGYSRRLQLCAEQVVGEHVLAKHRAHFLDTTQPAKERPAA